MFWRFGGYANISAIENIIDKGGFTLEDLLDENDLLQEIKHNNAKLLEFLRRDESLERLLRYVIAPKLEVVPPLAAASASASAAAASAAAEEKSADEEKERPARSRLMPFSRSRATSRTRTAEEEEEDLEKKRNRYAYVSAEVLSSDAWSIQEALLDKPHLIREFWTFLAQDLPLDPLRAGYFTKVNEILFEKKTEQMMHLFMSIPGAVSDLLRHVECPMIMDLLLKIIAADRHEGCQGIVEWLYSQDMMPALVSFLSPDQTWVVQTAAGEFIKAIITISANASQNEQTCIGPNELTRQLVSRPCIEQLIGYMLAGGNALTVGVGIIIEVIRKNNSDYDPDVGVENGSLPSSRDPIYLGSLLRLFAENVPNFMKLVDNAPVQKLRLDSTFGDKIEPLGFDRFKTCELMAELLHCSNMALLNEVESEELIAARDAERHRLRTEGRLSSHRGEEGPSTSSILEDATLRSALSPDEGRRLEVTNISDDDGFEEVEHSREMNEDTSHEFVKAEDEIPGGGPAFADKDDDDFVDEPLDSPKVKAQQDHGAGEEPQQTKFDAPELIVLPLSPKKKSDPDPDPQREGGGGGKEGGAPALSGDEVDGKKPDETGSETEESAAEEGSEDAKEPKPEEKAFRTDDRTGQASEAHPPREPGTQSAPERNGAGPPPPNDAQSTDSSSAPPAQGHAEQQQQQQPRDLPPHPEDVPAPLFSQPKSVIPTGPVENVDPRTPVDDPASAEFPEYSVAGIGKDDPASSAILTQEPEAEPGSPREETPKEGPAGSVGDPVVGDFLKVQFVEYQVVPKILSFFFNYPWNNFLHNVVYDVVQQVFNGPMDKGYNPTLAISLFESAEITTAIVKGQAASDELQIKMKTRMGYMGHLTLIAEEVVKFTERHPPEALSGAVMDKVMNPDWINYVEGPLAETRERDNAILGGVRPEVALSHRMNMQVNALVAVGLSNLSSAVGPGASHALAEAGLNGGIELGEGAGNGIGPFTISSGTLISGFGSSSDEEDDDGEDNEEDINSEFRAYTDPANNSSFAPPSVPPPPPPPAPLNAPPSRARLQLSARLAMRKKDEKAAAAVAAGASEETGDEPSTHGDDHHGDPFADDEEVDDVDSDDDDESGAWSRAASGRGGWWRDIVRRRPDPEEEKGAAHDLDSDDEEFGDFAMPEVDTVAHGIASDKVIRPLAVHPPAAGSGTSSPGQKSTFGNLWPFTSQVTTTTTTSTTVTTSPAKTGEGLMITNNGGGSGEPGQREEGKGKNVVIGEDGQEVEKVTEAKRRMSIEDPDEDEVVL